MTDKQLQRWSRWLHWHTPLVSRPFRRIAIRALAAARLDPAALPPLIAALDSPDARVAATADAALQSLGQNPKCVDALCAHWAKTRETALAEIIAACGYVAGKPVDVRVLSALVAGQMEGICAEAEAIPEITTALAEKDAAISQNAAVALCRHTAEDALIDHALDDAAGAPLLAIIAERGLRHSIEGRWFLLLALAGRFEEYLAEDFEFHTLRAEFQAAPPALQGRIRESIVKAGDVRMNPLFVAEKKSAALAELSAADAEALVRMNARNKNWEPFYQYGGKPWGFLWFLPARQILEALHAMAAARWKPDDADHAALHERLATLAAGAAAPAPTVAVLPPAMQSWLAAGEPGEPAALKALLKDETPPPRQLAALGTLQKRHALDPAALAAAARSGHWMVRLAAAHLGASPEVADDGVKEWIERLTLVRDVETEWSMKPSQLTREGLDVLRENLPATGAATGLRLAEAIASHYTAHDIEVETGARVLLGEDDFEVGG